MPEGDVELSLPPLDRRKIFDEERKIRRQLDDMLPDEEDAEQEARLPSLSKAKQRLHRSEREATTYCSRALRAAQEAGVAWSVPEDAGIHVPLPPPLPDAVPNQEDEATEANAKEEEKEEKVVKKTKKGSKKEKVSKDQHELNEQVTNPIDTAVPDKSLMLKLKDIRKTLLGKNLLLFWPEEGKWYRVEVVKINAKKRRAVVLYETGEDEELELEDIVKNQEVAWDSEKHSLGNDDEGEEAMEADQDNAEGEEASPTTKPESPPGAVRRSGRKRGEPQEEETIPVEDSRKSSRKRKQVDEMKSAKEEAIVPSGEETLRRGGRKRGRLQHEETVVPDNKAAPSQSTYKKIKIKVTAPAAPKEREIPTVKLSKAGRLRLESAGLANLSVGARVSVEFPLAGANCTGTVKKIDTDGSFLVEYDREDSAIEIVEELIDVNHAAVSLL